MSDPKSIMANVINEDVINSLTPDQLKRLAEMLEKVK
jgi:hypothetical protein